MGGRLFIGGILLLVSLAGIVHGCRACLAFVLYFQSKYGAANDSISGILRRNETAHGLYPFNTYSCSWTARKAYAAARGLSGRERDAMLAAARLWCERGLTRNRYKRELQVLKTELLKDKSPAEALKIWEPYVEWNFWNPANHVLLVELYAAVGDFAKAEQSLGLLRGRREHAEAKRRLEAARSSGPPS
jgi:hypothetical protein